MQVIMAYAKDNPSIEFSEWNIIWQRICIRKSSFGIDILKIVIRADESRKGCDGMLILSATTYPCTQSYNYA